MTTDTPNSTRNRTAAEAAHDLGLSVTTIDRYARRGCPHSKDRPRKFNPEEIAAWMVEHNLDGEVGQPHEPKSPERQEADLALSKARALKVEHEVSAMKARYVELDEVDRVFRELSATVRDGFADFPKVMAARLTGQDAESIERIMADEIARRLKAIADDGV